MSNDNKKYLREFGVHKVTIEDVKKTEWRGQQSLVLVLHDTAKDRFIDAKFKLPFSDPNNSIAKNQFTSIMKTLGVADAKALKGLECVVLVAPSYYTDKRSGQEKMYWNPAKFFSPKTADLIGKDMGAADAELGDLFGVDAGEGLNTEKGKDEFGDLNF